jgi:HAD superfamily hydrolase (TIGR01490 family)
MSRNIAFFDFDGTITKSDSFFGAIKYVVGLKILLFKAVILIPILVLYKLKLISNSKAKKIVFSFYFRGYNYRYLKEKLEEFSLNIVPTIVRKKAKDQLDWHIKQGDEVVIVSASFEEWVEPWAMQNGYKTIATKIEFNGDIVTGGFKTKNCHGIEKVNRIKKEYQLSDFETIYAYGDTSGDRAMLDIADIAKYREFE